VHDDYFEKYGFPLPMDDIREYWEDWKMPEQIDYKAMNDHDLLVMAVMQGNDTVAQQEKMIGQLEKMNGTVKSDHAWVCAYRYAFYAVFVILATIVTGNRVGWW